MMTLDELTQAMHDFVDGKGWYAPNTSKPQTPKNIACSLVIEAAEILEHFQWSDDSKNPQDLPGELADVALYLLQLASVTEINLEQAILDKIRSREETFFNVRLINNENFELNKKRMDSLNFIAIHV